MSSAVRTAWRHSARTSRASAAAAWNADVAGAVIEVADALVDPGRDAADVTYVLERFRTRMHAAEAVVWSIAGMSARLVLRAGHSATPLAAFIDLGESTNAIERLRRNATVMCRSDEISGVEVFVPDSVRSFVVAAALSEGEVTGALVLGWDRAVPPCDPESAALLRIAAGLFTTRARVSDPPPESSLHDAMFDSLADRVAVVDREGAILAVNAAWTTEADRRGILPGGAIEGLSFREVLRRAGDSPDAIAAFEGIRAVSTGARESFEMAYASDLATDGQWCVMTVRALRHRGGGAVIVDADVTSANVMALAERMSVDLSHRLADHVPVPLWSMTPEGRILFANQAWWQAAGLSDGGSTDPTAWLDAMHPDDRQAASSALAIAVSYRQRFEVELRLQAGDGTYRWWSIVGVPRSAADGSVESLLGIATDVTRARHAQQALRQLGAKLVAAQEAERRRIAGELHDDLGQQVMLLASKLTAARQERASLRTLQASITEAWQDVQEIASSIHNLAHQLHPARLQLFGLVQTLEMLCRDVSSETGLQISFDAQGVPSDIGEDTTVCLFRVAQEALQNAVKHSDAHAIAMQCSARESHLLLRVADDGVGLSAQALPSIGLGLKTMRERVELTGGTLTVETQHPHGTVVEAVIPMTNALAPE